MNSSFGFAGDCENRPREKAPMPDNDGPRNAYQDFRRHLKEMPIRYSDIA